MIIIIIICILSACTFAADEPGANTPWHERSRTRRSSASTSRESNPTYPEHHTLGYMPQFEPEHAYETRSDTPQMLRQLLPRRPSASTLREPKPTYQEQHAIGSSPEAAPDYSPKICSDWVRFYGFGDDFSVNFQRAQAFRYDYGIHFWAASFIYGLFQTEYYFNIAKYTPDQFCERHVHVYAVYGFTSLEDAEFTCEGWINFYGYNHILEFGYNYHWITKRDRSMDPYISIWAKTYFDYITDKGKTIPITSTQFCNGVGIPTVDLPGVYQFMKLDGSNMSCINYKDFNRFNYFWKGEKIDSDVRKAENRMPNFKFKSINYTYISCESWITEYGYLEENLNWNTNKIWGRDPWFDKYLPEWTRRYVKDVTRKLTDRNVEYIKTPKVFCQSRRRPAQLLLNFNGKTLQEIQGQDLVQNQDQDSDSL